MTRKTENSQSLLTSAATKGGRAKVIPEKNTLLLEYQRRWVEDRSRLKLAEKSRQIGWTWATAYRLVREKALVDARNDAWISSRDDLQARLFLEDCKAFAGVLQIGARDLGERVVDESGHSAYVLSFANGLRLHSMSSNPDAQAGKRGDRVLDEFALHPDPRKLYAIAYPGITWGGSLEIFSTHRGSHNFFNELVQEIRHKGNPKGFSLHRVTLQDALDQGFLYKLQSKLPAEDQRQEMDEAAYFDFVRAGCADEESFQQEFMCVPADDASAFLSYDLIATCEYTVPEWPLIEARPLESFEGELYVGMDVGRKKDLSVIWVNEVLGDVAYTRRVIVLDRVPFWRQEEILYPILDLPRLRRCCIDNTGLGMQMAENAKRRFGWKVEEITFTNTVKEELAYPVRSAFEDRTVRVPNEAKVRSDFRAIKKEVTASGNVRFVADASENGHSDRFWALALAVHARKGNTTPMLPRSFGGRRARAVRARGERSLAG